MAGRLGVTKQAAATTVELPERQGYVARRDLALVAGGASLRLDLPGWLSDRASE